MAPMPSFQTIFAVPITCQSCIEDISVSLHQLNGVQKVEGDLEKQLVSIRGTASPSAIVTAIQSTGRDAILRGSGDANSAAVCILETHEETVKDKVKGLVRMVQVAPHTTIVDLTLRGITPGSYWATIREKGDISRGAISVGALWGESLTRADATRVEAPRFKSRAILGVVEVGKDGLGSIFLDTPLQIWEIIGRSILVSKQHDGERGFERNDADTVLGVIARSAGIWENDKTVCSCSGKTLWEEREDEWKKGRI